MKLAPLIDKLLTIPVYAGRVSAATTLEAAVDKVKTQPMPACVLFGVTEEPGPQRLATGGVSHRVRVTLSLLIVTRSAADMRGAAAYAALDSVRNDTIDELLAWKPTDQELGDDWGLMEYAEGRLAWADAGTLIWLDKFKTEYTLTHLRQ